MPKKWFIVDAHHHFLPAEAANRLTVVDGFDYAGRMKERGRCYFNGQNIEGTIKIMEESKVDLVVLNQSSWSDCGVGVCQVMNDAYARIAKQYPGKFIACAHVPLNTEPATLAELDRAVKELGLPAVSLVASSARYSIGSEKLFPLYEKIAGLDLTIVVHPTVRTPLWGGTGMLMGSGVSREYDIAKATVELMNTVLPEYPDLRFLIPHLGGGIVGLKGRIMARFEPKGWKVPPEIKGAAKSPREQQELGLDTAFENIFNKLYFDTAGSGGWIPNTRAALMAIRPDRICFGSDYPFDVHEPIDVSVFIDKIKGLEIPEADKQDILGRNVKRLFKLS